MTNGPITQDVKQANQHNPARELIAAFMRAHGRQPDRYEFVGKHGGVDYYFDGVNGVLTYIGVFDAKKLEQRVAEQKKQLEAQGQTMHANQRQRMDVRVERVLKLRFCIGDKSIDYTVSGDTSGDTDRGLSIFETMVLEMQHAYTMEQEERKHAAQTQYQGHTQGGIQSGQHSVADPACSHNNVCGGAFSINERNHGTGDDGCTTTYDARGTGGT